MIPLDSSGSSHFSVNEVDLTSVILRFWGGEAAKM